MPSFSPEYWLLISAVGLVGILAFFRILAATLEQEAYMTKFKAQCALLREEYAARLRLIRDQRHNSDVIIVEEAAPESAPAPAPAAQPESQAA